MLGLDNSDMLPEPAPERSRALGECLCKLRSELDWELLGRTYCHEGGETFFPPEQQDLLLEAGLEFATDLGAVLDRFPTATPGASLYVGGALFELVPALFEALVLDRRVVMLNLDSAETRELNRALRWVEEDLGRGLFRLETRGFPPLAEGLFDQVWMTSVLSDPEAFPALHDELYRRAGTELAVGGGDPVRERKEASLLLGRALDRARRPCVFTTTDEELTFLELACAQRGLELEVPDRARLSGIVGDPVRHCVLR